MALTEVQQKAVANVVASCASQVWQMLPDLNKEDLYDAIGAADAWKDAAKASYNSALPVNFRTNATAAQKTLVLAAVVAVDYLLDDPQSADVFACIAGRLQKAAGV